MLQRKIIGLETCSGDQRIGAESSTGAREHRGEPETPRRPVVFTSSGHREEAREEEEGGVMKRSVRARRSSSEGREISQESRELRWRLNQLEKENLKLSVRHNQEVCFLQAEVARFRSFMERGEAQRMKLQFLLAASRRESNRVAELDRDRTALTEKSAELQQTIAELRKTLQVSQQARQDDQQALQQEVEERDQLIQNFSSENQRLHQLLQDQQAALEASERKMADLLRERQKEAEESRLLAEELKTLQERSSREKEIADEKVKHLEANLEAAKTAHLESRSNLELRVRDLEAAVAVEKSGHKEAQCNLELLRTHFRELERAYSLERERRGHTEHTLERLQTEFNHCKTEMAVALETEKKATSDLSKKREEEKNQLGKTQSLLQQAAAQRSEAEDAFHSFLQQIIALLGTTAQNTAQPAKHDGKPSPAEVLQLLAVTLSTKQHRLEETTLQVQDLLAATQKLHEENQLLQQLTTDQQKQIGEAQQVLGQLQDEVSDWSMQNAALQEELQTVKEESRKEIREMRDEFSKESAVRLAFLHHLNQRLLTGCVLIQPPHSILGDFTWRELCDVISEQVEQMTSDLHQAKDKIAHLQSVCDKKSVCVRELKRSQECVLSSLQENMKRKEETWSQQHTHTVNQLQNQLQMCRSQCDARVSSLEHRCSSLTSDLSRSRRESLSLSAACGLLAGALRHAHGCVRSLSEQKAVLGRRLVERERLELEVRKLADALGGERTEEEEEEERGRRARRRWRSGAGAVMAVNRWTALRKETEVVLRLERSGGSVCVCAAPRTAAQKGAEVPERVFSRWLRSKSLSAIILSSMVDLQGALADSDSSPAHVMAAARSGFSRLLDQLLDQSARSVSSGSAERIAERSSLKVEVEVWIWFCRTSPSADLMSPRQTLISGLQQHFLLFSQRLHAAEVERRSLRLEVSNLKKGLQQERAELVLMVPTERFQTACEELRLSLNREQEAQELIQEQSRQLQLLQQRVDKLASEQHTLTHSKQLSRKESSLRILGKQLAGVQKEKRQLEQQLQGAEEQLRDAVRRQQFVILCLKAAESSCKQVRESLAQSQNSAPTQRRPLLFTLDYLNMSDEKHLMAAPEVAACQSFLSVVSQLHQACCSRMDWLEQEVSAHHSHVTALRGELQDACLRENLAFIPVDALPGPEGDEEKRDFLPLSGFSEKPICKEDVTRLF
ncbi:LOW QUALITY PROTEIN: coiled-coil domain-containing protein 171 [Xiphophorus couchianus]|uniref:LOW QUALITY PROTEIN: coiled-coil domain-containing protein 171 n=1 Tax=Xiphophorus couchianus TaxID=32473 RepID=UPI001016D2B4|nr:LOW QUALITY PROTEIN: coiled-coil domain-containing protein 171 [Xiphophorus couchianus]